MSTQSLFHNLKIIIIVNIAKNKFNCVILHMLLSNTIKIYFAVY